MMLIVAMQGFVRYNTGYGSNVMLEMMDNDSLQSSRLKSAPHVYCVLVMTFLNEHLCSRLHAQRPNSQSAPR